MKHRRVFIIGMALALLTLFAAMPALTRASGNGSISNFKYSHTNSAGNWVFTWDTYPDKHSIDRFQFKGGGWQKVYTSMYVISWSKSSGTTKAVVSPVYSAPGYSLQFRVRLEIGDDVYTSYATTSHTFN